MPFSESLSKLLSIKFMKHILRTDKGGSQKLELSSLFHRELVNLFMKPILFLTDNLQLLINIIKILHVFRVALFLVSQRLILTMDILLFALG